MRGVDRILVSCAVMLALLPSCARPVGDEFGLAGTAWVLSSLGGEPLLENTNITLEFGRESFDGYSGCNWYGGNYTVTDTAVSFAEVASTARACTEPAGVMQQEERYGQALYKAATYRVTGSRLELLGGASIAMTFTRGTRVQKP